MKISIPEVRPKCPAVPFAKRAALALPFLTAGSVKIARAAEPHPDAELIEHEPALRSSRLPMASFAPLGLH
jgi:hypothetical protein